MNAKASPLKISIAAPCPARWEDLAGNDRVRFCDHCRKSVYNISVLTPSEADALLKAQNGNLCARIYRRTDRTVLMRDCPVGLARQWRHLKILASSGVAVILLILVHIQALISDKAKGPPARLSQNSLLVAAGNFLSPLAERLNLLPSPVMGKVRAVALPKPSPRVLMGEIAVTNSTAVPPTNK